MALINPDNVSFSHYGKTFQEKIFQGLLTDHIWAGQMFEVMHPDFLDITYLSYLTSKYFSYYEKYKSFPSLSLLVTIIKDDLSDNHDTILRDQIVEFLYRVKMNPDMGDVDYIKDKSLDFCKRQGFKAALEKSVELIQTDKFESVLGLMKEAVAIGMPNGIGHDFFDDAPARFIKVNRQVCPTGISALDRKDILRGGLGRGEIGVITANTGVGKSHFLVSLGANAMKVGKNVIHYTFELSEHAVGLRYDSHFCDIPSNEIQDRKEEVLEKYKDLSLGRLIIKEYPTGSASVVTLRSHIEKLMLRGFIPSILIVDYADIMRATRGYDTLRHELKLVYEELRNLSMDLNIPVWTASQAHRDSANSDIVGLENMAEAYGKAMVADVVLSISRKPMEKSSGSGRLFVAKNRAGKDGLIFPIHIDTSRSIIKIIDEHALSLEEAVANDSSDMKNLLKKKWKEVKNF